MQQAGRSQVSKTECPCETAINALAPADFFSTREHVLHCSLIKCRRDWVLEAIKSRSNLAACYRVFASKVDLDEDLKNLTPAFRLSEDEAKDDRLAEENLSVPVHRLTRLYELKFVWRFLNRRYAHTAAKVVSEHMSALGEGLGWEAWRFKDRFLIRLFVGICAGFFLIGSSGEVLDFIRALSHSGYWSMALIANIVLASFFVIADLQRRIGRLSSAVFRERYLSIMLIAMLYLGFGEAVQWLYYSYVQPFTFCTAAAGGQVVACPPAAAYLFTHGSFTLLFGLLFQLFWQDGSIGDPI